MSNPFVDQRRLVGGDAAVSVPAGIVRVTGADRHDLLNATLTQNMLAIAPGESREALQLDGNGHIERVLGVVETEDATLLLATGKSGADLAAWIDARVFLEDVRAVDAGSDYAVWGAVRPLGPLAWVDPWPAVAPGGTTYGEAEPPAWAWALTLLPAGDKPGLDAVPLDTLDPIRAAAHRPALAEVDDRSLPHELGWMRTAVHLDKGCYPGQETVAKIHNVGHPPRRLVGLHLDGSASVFAEAGDRVWLDDREVGTVTTAGNHFEDGPVALAVISRSIRVDATLEVVHDGTHIAATQVVIVPPSSGGTASERLRPTRR